MINDGRGLDDEVSFHLEKKEENTHSLTQEELIDDLRQKKESALAAARNYRRGCIVQFLSNNGIDSSTVDIEAILDGNIPKWFLELQQKAIQNIDSKKKDKFVDSDSDS